MDIKEYACGSIVVIGGIAYGVSQGGLGDALTEDVKNISAVSYEDRPAYMEGIVEDFSENFLIYMVQTESYDYVGNSSFSYIAEDGTFTEVVTSQEALSQDNVNVVKAELKASDFCEQQEMTMFTDKGWQYRFIMNDEKGNRFYQVTCQSDIPKLRLS